MKRFYILCLLGIILFVLSSCNIVSTTNDPLTSNTPTTTSKPNKTDLPSYAKLCEIQIGMKQEDVYALVGTPQREETRRVPLSSGASVAVDMLCYIYDSADGPSIGLTYNVQENEGNIEFIVGRILTITQDG